MAFALSSGSKISPQDHKEDQQETKYTKDNTLIVVSCTKSKIWDSNLLASFYLPAEIAYTGESFEEWNRLRNTYPKLKDFAWVILSAKYGFIEPEHPIGNYDVTFSKVDTGPISDESLKNQVLYQTRHLGNQDKKLSTFKYILVIGGNKYVRKIKTAFASTGAIISELSDKTCRQIDPI